MRRQKRSRTVFEDESPYVGRVRVIEDQRERRLMVHGETLSVYPINGDWSRVRREYWWHALAEARLPQRPRALLVGLGGGTQLHLLQRLVRPRAFTAVERDPVILRAAHEWFGLRGLGGVEYLCTDADTAAASAAAAGRRFDFVMEDVDYGDGGERSLPLLRTLAGLVAPGGVLVANRHRRREAAVVIDALRPLFGQVRERRVRREGENVLVVAARPRRRGTRAR
jgi:spermidine synthase